MEVRREDQAMEVRRAVGDMAVQVDGLQVVVDQAMEVRREHQAMVVRREDQAMEVRRADGHLAAVVQVDGPQAADQVAGRFFKNC
jgi:RNase P/RNase MRP subunit p29